MAPEEQKLEYWNGKTSDHPVIQEMIRVDNKEFQAYPNKYVEVEDDNNTEI